MTPKSQLVEMISILILVLILAYSNSFWGQYHLDDEQAILRNQSLRHFGALFPEKDSSSGGLLFNRPMVSFSFSANYQISKLNPWSYHVINLLIHILATLTLFGIIRRTLSLPSMKDRFGTASPWLAFFSALIWSLHPLQTESVTYIWQRCECQMGLFFLLTFYFAIRGWQTQKPLVWNLAAITSCFLGVLSKEIIIVVPFLILAYEIIFLKKNIKESLFRSPLLYIGLVIALTPMFYFLSKSYFSNPVVTAYFSNSIEKYSKLDLVLTQAEVITQYLKLVFWPHPLILDYGNFCFKSHQIWPQIVFVGGLIVGSGIALSRRQPIGFLGFWFFGILSVTSNGLLDIGPYFEHRMYLPLVAPVTLVVMSGFLLWKKWASGESALPAMVKFSQRSLIFFLIMVVIALGARTWCRNQDYGNNIVMLEKNNLFRPNNPRVEYNLGAALAQVGRNREAIPLLRKSVQFYSQRPEVLATLGSALGATGNIKEAKELLTKALNLHPECVNALYNFSLILLAEGRLSEAAQTLKKAEKFAPLSANVHSAIAFVQIRSGNLKSAREHIEIALEIEPENQRALGLLRTIQ